MEIITHVSVNCTYFFKCTYGVYKYARIAHKIKKRCAIMFKVEKPEMINKTFRLPAKLVQELQIIAQEQGVSLNNLVQQCCEYALKHLDKED